MNNDKIDSTGVSIKKKKFNSYNSIKILKIYGLQKKLWLFFVSKISKTYSSALILFSMKIK